MCVPLRGAQYDLCFLHVVRLCTHNTCVFSTPGVARFQTITSLCLDGSKTRLMSGALDGHVKVYDLQTFGMVYGMKYPSPVLSMACSVRLLGGCTRLGCVAGMPPAQSSSSAV
jgi:hypothetical protein